MAQKLTLNEIYSKIKSDYDVEALLEPYKAGGQEDKPIERSSGTILDWLINKKKFPPDVAGAGLISTLFEIRQGKAFKGDGTYGSPGRELVHYVASKCNELNRKNLAIQMFKTVAGAKLEVMDEVIFENVRAQIPFFVRLFATGSWRWLRKRRQAKKAKKES